MTRRNKTMCKGMEEEDDMEKEDEEEGVPTSGSPGLPPTSGFADFLILCLFNSRDFWEFTTGPRLRPRRKLRTRCLRVDWKPALTEGDHGWETCAGDAGPGIWDLLDRPYWVARARGRPGVADGASHAYGLTWGLICWLKFQAIISIECLTKTDAEQ